MIKDKREGCRIFHSCCRLKISQEYWSLDRNSFNCPRIVFDLSASLMKFAVHNTVHITVHIVHSLVYTFSLAPSGAQGVIISVCSSSSTSLSVALALALFSQVCVKSV